MVIHGRLILSQEGNRYFEEASGVRKKIICCQGKLESARSNRNPMSSASFRTWSTVIVCSGLMGTVLSLALYSTKMIWPPGLTDFMRFCTNLSVFRVIYCYRYNFLCFQERYNSNVDRHLQTLCILCHCLD